MSESFPPRGLSPAQEQKLLDGADPHITVEPTDLAGIPVEQLGDHEGDAILLTDGLLAYVSNNACNDRTACDHIEQTLDRHYNLEATGFGAAWDVRHRCARLVKL